MLDSVLRQRLDAQEGSQPAGSRGSDIVSLEQLLHGMPGQPSAAVLLASQPGGASSAGSSLLASTRGRSGSGGMLMRSHIGGAEGAFNTAGVLAPSVGRSTLEHVRVLGQVRLRRGWSGARHPTQQVLHALHPSWV